MHLLSYKAPLCYPGDPFPPPLPPPYPPVTPSPFASPRRADAARSNVLLPPPPFPPPPHLLPLPPLPADAARSNVAFTRAQRRLIVVASRAFLEHVPASGAAWQAMAVWKRLRAMCTTVLGEGQGLEGGHRVDVFAAP